MLPCWRCADDQKLQRPQESFNGKPLWKVFKFKQSDILRNLWSLTHFEPMFHCYTPWKHQKTGGFVMFLGGIEVEH